MKNCKQIATEWGLSERTVNDLCKKNKIDGAIKVGKMWKIPDDAKKPIDGRITSGKYVRHSAGVTRKPLPIGISDYVRAQADYYYVDKTMLIKEFLDQKPLVSLFTRPRRFGKTLNMDMLRVFFEISEENTSKYFEDKAIWQCGEEYRNQQGQYPVVFLTFKDVKFDSWKATLDKIRDLLQEEFGRHQELATSERIAEYEKTYFAKIINGDASEVDLTASLAKLSQMLTKHYGKAPIIIIDEYDTPIQEGYSKDFYDEIIGFMRNFFSGAFKDNKNLTYGFLTGILRIAQESIFSGLNNLTVNSVMDEEYDQFFGFTVSEVREMLKYYGVLDKEEELKDWYDGYLFGSTEIYNPWSVINYISRGCIPQAYWVNTGKNEILEDVLKVATEDITERLYSLLQGERVIARIDQNVVYRSLSEDPANIYSLLLVAGYLKTPKKELQADGSYLCEVSIPNREIAAVYKSEVLSHLLQIGAITRTTANKIAESLYANDYKNLQKAIAEYMDKSVSFYDAGAEGFYHGLVLGLIALMDNQYKIKSNRESGDNADLIVLDDPISAFDEKKKFGIIRRLFDNKKDSFKEKTVLMLTHDFQPIIDYVHGNFFTRYGLITPVHASFIQNIEGSICESPITMNDLKNTVELTKDIVMSSNASMAVKIVNLRKYVELTKPEFGTSAIYEVLSNVIHGRQNPIYKDGQEISADVLEQGMREVSQYIPNKSYTDLINGTSTEILISSMSSDDLYHRIISIRLLFERVEGTLSLLRKKYPAACKFVNETNHVENDYIYQLDPRKYFGIPNYYLQQIENFIQENKETILAGNILTENTELDQIGDN